MEGGERRVNKRVRKKETKAETKEEKKWTRKNESTKNTYVVVRL